MTKVNKKFVLILLITHCSLLFAQLPTQEWVARYPGPSNDLIGPFLQVDKQGNSYIAGTHLINDSMNILVVKYNTSGTQIWAALYKFPGESYFQPMGLALDTFGNAYITSLYGQTAFETNILTVKFNGSNGSVIWAKKYIGQFGESWANDIKIDKQNNIYVVGWSDSSHLCIKYNIIGDSVWVRRWQPPGDGAAGNACTIDDSLNIIITGQRRHCITFPPPGGCFDTLLTIKYSKDGDLRWLRTYHYDALINTGTKITSDQFGNIYVGGITRIQPYSVYLTLKYDRTGIQQWAKIYDGPGNGNNFLNGIIIDRFNNFLYVTGSSRELNNRVCATIKYNVLTGDSLWVKKDTGSYSNAGATDIKVDSTGNVYITGGTNNIPPGSSQDILLIKYLPQGNREWFVTYNGPFNGWDNGIVLELDYLKNVYVLGTSQSSSQVTDYIIIKYSQFSGIEPVSNEIPHSFKLFQNYPNPFNPLTKINYAIPKRSNVTLKIYDILGRLVKTLVNEQKEPGFYTVQFDGSAYASGVYFYKIEAGDFVQSKKMILVK